MGYTKITMGAESQQSILEDAKAYEESHVTNDSTGMIPVSFMNNAGSYIVRIFPDTYKNRTRISRTTFLHFLNFKNPSTGKDVKLRVVNDVKLSKLLDSYSDSDLGGDKFKFEAKEFSLVLMRIYQAPESDKYLSEALKNSKTGSIDAIVVLKPRVMKEIHSRIGELKPSQINEFLDIDTKTFALRITLTPESSQSGDFSWLKAEVSVTAEEYEMGLPKFPEGADWEGLENAYIPESKVITDTELSSLNLYLARLKDRNANYVESKTKDGFNNHQSMKDSDEPTWGTTNYTPGGLDDEAPF